MTAVDQSRSNRPAFWRIMVGITPGSIPELRGLPEARKRQIHAAAARRAERTGQTGWHLNWLIAGLLLSTVALARLARDLRWWAFLPYLGCLAVLWAAMNVAMHRVIRRCARAELGTHCPA